MQQRRFGRTGLSISPFTLGGGIVGGILVHPPDEVRLEALRLVTDAGCNWIDTAADYGGGESEKALGRLLPQLETQPQLSTKVRLDTTERDDLEGRIRRSLETSLTRLGRDRIELMQLHNPIGRSSDGHTIAVREVLGPGGVADVLDTLKGEGLFGAFGITALGDTAALIEVIDSGRFDTAQVYYNMLNPSAAQQMPPGWSGQDFAGVAAACSRHDLGIMAIRVLAGGVLASEEPHGREVSVTSDAALEREQARAQKLFARLGDRWGTRAATAIRYALAEDALSTIVVGAARLEHLREAIDAFEAGPLPNEALDEIAACHARDF